MVVEERSEVGNVQPKSLASRAKRDVKMSMFGMIFMMATWTRKRIDESLKSTKLAERPTDVARLLNIAVVVCHEHDSARARHFARTSTLHTAFVHMFTYESVLVSGGCIEWFYVLI